MISGWATLAKLLGLYEPERREVALTTCELADRPWLESMTDAELVAIIDGAK